MYGYYDHNTHLPNNGILNGQTTSIPNFNKENMYANFNQLASRSIFHEKNSNTNVGVQPKNITHNEQILYMRQKSEATEVIKPKSMMTHKQTEQPFQSNAGCSAAMHEGAQKRTNSESNITKYKHRRHNEPLNQMALQIMNGWYEQNAENPYPNKSQKEQVAKVSGITVSSQ